MNLFWQNLLSIPKNGELIFLELVFEDSEQPVKIEIQIFPGSIQRKASSFTHTLSHSEKSTLLALRLLNFYRCHTVSL